MAKRVAKPAKKPARISSRQDVVAPAELGRWIGIGAERVRQFAVEGVFARADRGRYPLRRNILAYISWLKNEERRANKGEAREELERERTRKLKLANDESERILVPTEDVLAAIDAIVGPIKSELAGVAVRVSDDVALRRKVEDAIDQVLAELAKRLAKAGDDLLAGRDALAAPAADVAEPVGEDE